MTKYLFPVFLCFVLLLNTLSAQGPWGENQDNPPPIPSANLMRNVKELMTDAEMYFNKGQYELARYYLEAILRKRPNYPVAQRLQALTFLRLEADELAAQAYLDLFKNKADLSRAAYFEAGLALMRCYRYDQALEYFILYKNAQAKDYQQGEETADLNYQRYIDQHIRNCRYALDAGQGLVEAAAEAQNMGSSINTKADEYMPTLSVDGKLLIFTSNSPGHEDIFVARQRKDSLSWSKPRSISGAVNTELNEGQAFLASCGRTLYFAACAWANVQGGCDIYQAEYDPSNDVFGAVSPAKGAVNSKAWDSQPSISCDGRTLYFASTRPGGYGGSDLWRCSLRPDGYWSEPENLGPEINTPFDEEAPYLAPDDSTLYFSSDGLPGFGEADIFRVVLKTDGTWTKPENLGPVYNTPFREAGISIAPSGDYAFFGSARRGGKGGLDLYRAVLPKVFAPKPHVMIDGRVYDELSKRPLDSVKVQMGREGQARKTYYTDVDGRFFACLPDNYAYSYILDKEGYETQVEADFFVRQSGEAFKEVRAFMTQHGASRLPTAPPPSVAANTNKRLRKNLSLYFASGKYDLLEIQISQVQELLEQVEDKSQLKVQIRGYADDEGDKEFNRLLSERRASLVAKEVERLGIDKANIQYDGLGVADANIAKHQKRRVDIILLVD